MYNGENGGAETALIFREKDRICLFILNEVI